MDVWRPCDTVETAVAWAAAIERADGPSCLLFTRQNVAFQSRDAAQIASIRRGGYVLADWNGASTKRAVIIATGSEVALAMGARMALAAEVSRRASYRCRPPPSSTARTSPTDERAAAGVRASPSKRARPAAGTNMSAPRRRARRDRRPRYLRRVGAGSGALQIFGFTVVNVVAA
jgi:hypothetical protein